MLHAPSPGRMYECYWVQDEKCEKITNLPPDSIPLKLQMDFDQLWLQNRERKLSSRNTKPNLPSSSSSSSLVEKFLSSFSEQSMLQYLKVTTRDGDQYTRVNAQKEWLCKCRLGLGEHDGPPGSIGSCVEIGVGSWAPVLPEWIHKNNGLDHDSSPSPKRVQNMRMKNDHFRRPICTQKVNTSKKRTTLRPRQSVG